MSGVELKNNKQDVNFRTSSSEIPILVTSEWRLVKTVKNNLR